jgi:hypothetical protein
MSASRIIPTAHVLEEVMTSVASDLADVQVHLTGITHGLNQVQQELDCDDDDFCLFTVLVDAIKAQQGVLNQLESKLNSTAYEATKAGA